MDHQTDRRALWFALVALACWGLLFAAATDVWHDTGRPDILGRLTQEGATRFDLRACVYAFYGLFVVLSVHVAVAGLALVRRR